MKYKNSITRLKTGKTAYQKNRESVAQLAPKELRNGLSYSLKSRLLNIAGNQESAQHTLFLLGLISAIEKLCQQGITSQRKLKEVLIYLSEFDPNTVVNKPWLS